MAKRQGKLLLGALLTMGVLLMAGCETISEKFGTQDTQLINTRNERQGETLRTRFRPAYAKKTGIQETIVHLDQAKLQFQQEFLFTSEHAAQTGIERERWYEHVNGNVEKRFFFSPAAQEQTGVSERLDLFNEHQKPIQSQLTYTPRYRQEQGVGSMLILYDINERKDREELSFTAEMVQRTGVASSVTKFRDGQAEREIKTFTDEHARTDGIVQRIAIFAPAQAGEAPRAERIEERYSEAFARQRGTARCQRFLDTTGVQVTRSECFDRDGRLVKP